MPPLRIEELPGFADHRAIIDRHIAGLDGGAIHPFDRMPRAFINGDGPEREQFRTMVRLGYTTLAVMLGGKDAIYPAGAITKGSAGNYAAVLSSLTDVRDLDERIPRLFREAVLPANKANMISFIGAASRIWPEHIQIPPALLEGAFGVMSREPEALQGAKLKDAVFMSVWIPLIANNISILPIQGDQFFSRSTHEEIGEAVSKAAGLRPIGDNPNSNIRLLDINQDPVSLLAIAKARLEYLVYAADHGLVLDVEPTELARDLDIYDRYIKGQLHHAHHEFARGIEENRADMAVFAKNARAFLVEGVARGRFDINTSDLTNVKFVQACASAEQKRKGEPDFSPFSGKLKGFELVPVDSVKRPLSNALGQFTQDDLVVPAVVMPRKGFPRGVQPAVVDLHLDGKFFEKIAGQTIFEENVFSQFATHGDVAQRALLQIRFLLGAMDSVIDPARPGTVTYMGASPDYGPQARSVLRAHNKGRAPKLESTDQLRSAPDVDFDAQVVRPQSQWIASQETALRGKNVRAFSLLDFKQLFSALEIAPNLLVAQGENNPVRRVETMLRQAWLRRHATDFDYVRGRWEGDADLVQDMVLATKMQLGLVAGAGPTSNNVAVRIDNMDASLADRIRPLWEQVKDIKDGRTSELIKEQRTAIVQMCALGEMLLQHQERARIFGAMRDDGLHTPAADAAWQNVPSALRHDLGAFTKLWDEIKSALGDNEAFALDVRATHFHLMPQLKGVNAVITAHRAGQGLQRSGTTQHGIRVDSGRDANGPR